MSFLSKIGQFGDDFLSSLNEQTVSSENTIRSLDTVDPNDPDRVINFGALGDFAKRIDQSAQRSYVESGYIRNVKPNFYETLFQEPNVTIAIKKRIFSSLTDNYRIDLMDTGDKLFFRASKKLFQNKCNAISAYEKLSKIEKVVKNKGVLDEYMVPAILEGVDSLDALGVDIIDPKTRATLDTIRKLTLLSEPNQFTSWIVDRNTAFASDTGEGTGVFELTTVSSVNTTTGVNFKSGKASLDIEDPYNLMTVTNEDIEKAISDATNFLKQYSFTTVAESELDKVTNEFKQQLNQLRAARNASSITFLVNSTTLLFKRVRAIIDEEGKDIIFNHDGGLLGIGASVQLDASAYEGPNGLSKERVDISINTNLGSKKSEEELFKDIIRNTFQLLGLRDSTISAITNFNDLSTELGREVHYTREKMRLHYGNKTIIQPMDVVYVFMESKTIVDNKVIGLFEKSFSGGDIIQGISNTINKIQTSFNDMKSFFGGGAKDSAVEIEKNAVVGPDFPMWLWILLRNDFTKQAAGVSTFVGPVTGASSKYDASSGKYTVSVDISDNSHYFDISQINLNPSPDVFNSVIYDPLTPFKTDFDASSGILKGEEPELLYENKIILNSQNVKFKNGRFRGSQVSPALYMTKDGEFSVTNAPFNFRQIKNDPDGFVYRWKTGIGSQVVFGEPHPTSSLQQDSAPKLTKDPFAGQDVMNVLSLLITAQPYNYNTFMKAAVDSGAINRDDLTNKSGTKSFYQGLLSELTEQNSVWGNFIPFKKLVVSEQAYNFLASGQFDISQANQKINDLIEQRARFFDLLVQSPDGFKFANNPRIFNINIQGQKTSVSLTDNITGTELTSSSTQQALIQIAALDAKIAEQQNEMRQKIANSNLGDAGGIRIFGNDLSFDPTVSGDSTYVTQQQLQQQRIDFRKKLNSLTQRRFWKVKSNDDKNLFIVDDQYDKNYDIQAFEKSLSSLQQLFKNDYSKIADKIGIVKDILGLEVFADSQGNIQARPPAYNKVPSSVFERMLHNRAKTGVRIFPKLLESLFVNQVDGLTQQIEITEDNIRLQASALGKIVDSDIEKLLSKPVNMDMIASNFKFVTDSNGKFGTRDIRSLISQVSPEDFEETRKSLSSFNSQITGQLNATTFFGTDTRIEILNSTNIFQSVTNSSESVRVQQIINRLQQAQGVAPAVPKPAINASSGTLQGDVLQIVNKLASLISERQNLLKQMSASLKNLEDGVVIENDTGLPRKQLFPNLSTRTIPPIIEHMIEYEDNDDLGPGSGGRYIIKENQIINLTVTENSPSYTAVEVSGLFGEGYTPPPTSLSISDFGSGGNAITAAFAVDYDMWRMYGFRKAPAQNAPFLSDAQAQCVPFAVYLLNLARKNILQANLTIVGNEYMQPGEVIYIESKDLLFYVESVSHSFNYGGFTTSMKLTYGHNPGEYIPTILDIIGKGLYSKQNQANLIRHNRHGNASGDVPLTVLAIDSSVSQSLRDNDPLTSLLRGRFASRNIKSLANMVVALGNITAPNSSKNPTIELRSYKSEQQGIPENSDLEDIKTAIISWLKTPSTRSTQDSNNLLPDNDLPDEIRQNINIESRVIDSKDTESPSSKAWGAARYLVLNDANFNQGATEVDIEDGKIAPEEVILFQNVIDIWISFDTVPKTVSTNKNKTSITDQATQEATALVQSTFKLADQ
jgi:hypothetical protein